VYSGVPQLAEGVRIAFLGDPDTPPYSLRIMRNGTELEISGGFKFGLHDDLVRLVRATPHLRTVHLDSIGGRIGEATKVYRTIRELGLTTYVSNRCLSACTLAFAAGKERCIAPHGNLGFHSMAFPGTSREELADALRDQRTLMLDAGFDPAFVSKALATPNSDMWYPTLPEMLDAHVVTGIAPRRQFAASGLGAGTDREKLGTTLKAAVPALRALEELRPADYQALLTEYFDNYLGGESQEKLDGILNKRLGSVVRASLSSADDRTLLAMAQLLVDEYTALGSTDPAVCYGYAVGTRADVASYLPVALQQQELALDERILRTSGRRPTISEQTAEAAAGRVFTQLTKRIGKAKVQIFLQAKVDPKRYADYCSSVVAFYQEVLKLDAAEGAALLRHTFSEE
jgi:hypothetical protein